MYNDKSLKFMNINHDYYYKVQAALHITKRKYCIFALYTQKGRLHIIHVERDDEFWKKKDEGAFEKFLL